MISEAYVYKKEADWSLFNYGFAIPFEYQVVFNQISDRFLGRGESKPITLYLNGLAYQATLSNLKIAPKHDARKDIVQVRYSAGSDLAAALRGCLAKSYQYIQKMKKMQDPGSKQHILLPEECKEYLVIYTTEYDDTYVLEAITAEDITIVKDMVYQSPEQQIEFEFNYGAIDNNAGIQFRERMVKIRKLNRSIGDNLKVLYGYRCQICGQLIGEELGSHVVEAHHIDYFVKSLNNDAGNQMVVCPNHHRIIHELNPVFDRRRIAYYYPNGYEQRLTLNVHL